MARFYSNENFPLPVVVALRRAGHDVLTSAEAGNANRRIPDDQVLAYATQELRAVLTLNRRDFAMKPLCGQVGLRMLELSYVLLMRITIARQAEFWRWWQRLHRSRGN